MITLVYSLVLPRTLARCHNELSFKLKSSEEVSLAIKSCRGAQIFTLFSLDFVQLCFFFSYCEQNCHSACTLPPPPTLISRLPADGPVISPNKQNITSGYKPHRPPPQPRT